MKKIMIEKKDEILGYETDIRKSLSDWKRDIDLYINKHGPDAKLYFNLRAERYSEEYITMGILYLEEETDEQFQKRVEKAIKFQERKALKKLTAQQRQEEADRKKLVQILKKYPTMLEEINNEPQERQT